MSGHHREKGRHRATGRPGPRLAALAVSSGIVFAASALLAADPAPSTTRHAPPATDEGSPPPDWYGVEDETSPESGPSDTSTRTVRRRYLLPARPTAGATPRTSPPAPAPTNAPPLDEPVPLDAPTPTTAPSDPPEPSPTGRPRNTRRCRKHPDRPRCATPSPSPTADPLIQLPPLPNL